MNTEALTATLEDYLEAIYTIVSRHKVARSMEIADRLNVKRPTVTVALRALAQKGLINYEPRSYVTLTSKGEKVARCVDKRHHVLRDVFTRVLMLEPEDADEAACLMEHGMNTRVCRALTSLLSAVHKDQGLAGTLRAAIEKENARLDCDNDKCDYSVPGKEIDTMKEEPMNLNMIEQGTSATILRIQGTGSLKKRLREMGITAGQQVLVVKSAPLDDPIEVKVRNYNLSLRREEAGSILVE